MSDAEVLACKHDGTSHNGGVSEEDGTDSSDSCGYKKACSGPTVPWVQNVTCTCICVDVIKDTSSGAY